MALWTPSYIDTPLSLWLDATDVSSLTVVDGSVSQWDDKSGSGKHFAQATVSCRPARVVDGVQFSSLSSTDPLLQDYLTLSSVLLRGHPYEVFAVLDGHVSSGAVVASGTNETYYAGLFSTMAHHRGAQFRSAYHTVDWAGGTGNLVYGWFGDSLLSAQTNAVQNGTTTASEVTLGTTGSTWLGINRVASSMYPTDALNATVREVIVAHGGLSSDNKKLLEGYLAHKWGLADKLPADHRYKGAAPMVGGVSGSASGAILCSGEAVGYHAIKADVAEQISAGTALSLERACYTFGEDGLSLSDTLVGQTAFAVLESIIFSDSSFAQQIFQYSVASGVGLRSGLAFGHSLVATSHVLAADAGAAEFVTHVLETVYASDLYVVQRVLHTQVATTLTLEDALTQLVLLLAEENISLDAASLAERVATLRAIEQLKLHDSALAKYILSANVIENTTLADSLQNLLFLLSQDALALNASVQETINRMLLARDVLSVLSPSATQAELTLLVATTVAMHTTLEAALLLLAEDVLAVADEVVALRDAFISAMENLTLGATPTASVSFVVMGNDSLAMQDEGLNFANFTIAVEDVISFAGVITLPDGSQYTAWATTLSTRAPYEYHNYPFNSFATMGDKHYGLKDDGLYLLQGDTDDGEAIEAHIKTGLLDFGTQHLKNVVRAYLGYHADGGLTLHVTDTDGGDKREVVYELDQTHDAYKEARLKLGKGVRARYWQFELRNADGADFRLDALDVLPVVLKRRV